MKHRWVLSIIVAALPTALAACTGAASGGAEEIQVKVLEFKYESARTTFARGAQYRFVLNNAGTLAHEWAIMPRGEKDHMKSLVMVEDSKLRPGSTATRDFIFSRTGDYEFACHLPGHYEAEMVLPIVVQ